MPSGRRLPPVRPAERMAGSTGSTHGDTAVPAPAMKAKRMSRANPPKSRLASPRYRHRMAPMAQADDAAVETELPERRLSPWESMLEATGARLCYGEPVKDGERTVIPVASVEA